MDVHLIVMRGAKPAKVRLRLPTTIGRSPDASLKVRDTQVSRRHCELFEDEGRLMVRDLGSVNGTYVDKKRIEGDTLLSPGGMLSVGPIAMRADYEGPPEAPVSGDSFIDLDMDHGGDEASQSVVQYRETPEGSFIDITDDDQPAKAPDNAPDDNSAADEAVESSAVAAMAALQAGDKAAKGAAASDDAPQQPKRGPATPESRQPEEKQEPAAEEKSTEKKEDESPIDLDDPATKQVDSDDDALQDFFKSMG